MAVASELVGFATVLATRPFSLIRLVCVIGARAGFVVLHTWLEITKAAVSLHVSLLWKLISCTIAIASLPFRILNALQRERQLEAGLRFLRVELEELILERKELEERFSRAVRERKMLEFMLTEVEDDCDKILTRVELLEEELRVVKTENLLLKKTRRDDAGSDPGVMEEALLEDLSFREREAALKRSLFSAMLSLFVGVTIWESKEACMSLVTALFAVVTISLLSVLHFISTIGKNKPTLDAVALLSLNWFILGTLSYPVLPRVARISVPPSVTLAHHVARFMGGSTRS